MHYLKQLSQLAILNFFFIFLLVLLVNKIVPEKTKTKAMQLSPAAFSSSSSLSQGNSLVPEKTDQVLNQPELSSSQSSSSTSQSLSEQLPSHNNPSDCWMAIDGRIYNITAYFGSHPGGDGRLLAYCGQDATAAYHTKDNSGRDHSAQASAILQQFLIQ